MRLYMRKPNDIKLYQLYIEIMDKNRLSKSKRSSSGSKKSSKSQSAFNKEDRENIVRQIEKLDSKHYTKIFCIFMEDEYNSYTHNSNGVFLNLSVVSDDTMYKIEKYLTKLEKENKKKSKTIELDEDVIPCNLGCASDDRVYRLSNYEKNILKHKNMNKNLGEDETEYEEIKFPSKKKNHKKNLEM